MSQSQPLEYAGIYKARPVWWGVKKDEKGKPKVSIKYLVLECLTNGQWVDWRESLRSIFGDHYLIKNDGTVNDSTIQQLALSIGFDGGMEMFNRPPPESLVVQINVKLESYQGKDSLKVKWLNPGDYTPKPKEIDPAPAREVEAQFGSLLRAAAAGAKAKAK